jgi:hypothetical protein
MILGRKFLSLTGLSASLSPHFFVAAELEKPTAHPHYHQHTGVDIMTLALISNITALSLAFLFFLAGAAHIVNIRSLRATYRRWRFSPGFPYVTGIAQLFTAVFLAVPQTRIWGGILAAAILFVTVVWLLNRGRYLYAVPAILAMLLLAPAVAVPM